MPLAKRLALHPDTDVNAYIQLAYIYQQMRKPALVIETATAGLRRYGLSYSLTDCLVQAYATQGRDGELVALLADRRFVAGSITRATKRWAWPSCASAAMRKPSRR